MQPKLSDNLLRWFNFILGYFSVTSSLNLICYVIGFLLVFGLIRLGYSIYFISHFGGTLGKLIFNLKIVDNNTNELISNKRAFYRLFIGYAFSFQFVAWGFLRIIKNSNKLTWHDELFDTKVVSKGSAFSGVITFVGLLILTSFFSFKIYTTVENSKYFYYVIELFQSATTP